MKLRKIRAICNNDIKFEAQKPHKQAYFWLWLVITVSKFDQSPCKRANSYVLSLGSRKFIFLFSQSHNDIMSRLTYEWIEDNTKWHSNFDASRKPQKLLANLRISHFILSSNFTDVVDFACVHTTYNTHPITQHTRKYEITIISVQFSFFFFSYIEFTNCQWAHLFNFHAMWPLCSTVAAVAVVKRPKTVLCHQ